MTNSYYNHATYPAPNAPGSSAALRAELDLVTDGFDKLPSLAGNANKIVIVNAANTALDVTAVLPSLGVIDSTFLIQDDADATKKFQFQASGISPGTTRVLTIPNANLTIVGTDTTQTLTNKTLTSPAINTPVLNGGTIDNAVIGGGTPAAATFTSLASSSATVSGVAVVTLSATQTLTNKTISGGTVTGAAVTGLSAPSVNSDAATKVYVDTADALKLNLSGGTLSGALAMGTNKITGLGTPTADTDAATKAYVDGVAQGLNVKASVRVATTANITLSGTQTIDGVSVIVGNRVLVKNQSTAANNGIYVVASGSWTRSTDMDAWTEFPGAFVFVEEGAVNDNAGWVCTASAGGTLGVTDVTFEQFSGAGQITAGAGLTKSGNTLDVGTASASRIVVNADNIDLATTGVSAATYQSVTVDAYGRVTAGTNPTTVSGYGITDVYTKTEVDNSLALKLSLTGGTMSGNIAMGGSKVTGLGAPSASSDAVTLDYVTTLYGSTASAASSAADALTYKTAAESAATTATTQASTATTQAGIATTQAGIATTQASNALSSANAAAASFDSFDDRYLGAKNTPPMVDNDGNPLLTGALYFDTTTNEMKVYSGSAWLSSYLPAGSYLTLSGGTMTGAIAMGSNKITNLGTPTASADATTKTYVDNADASKQDTLVSGTNIKTVNGSTLLGSGNLTIGSTTITIDGKTGAYTVLSTDLGKIINCTANTFTVSLTAAATLGSGFNCWIWNTGTGAITIDPNASETIDGATTLVLRQNEGTQIVCDGSNWQTGDKKTMRGYTDNIPSTYGKPIASGAGAIALGNRNGDNSFLAQATGTRSFSVNGFATSNYSSAIGQNSGGGGAEASTGAGAMALGGSYASGADSFAAAVANNSNSYGATGANSIAIGYLAKATGADSIAIGDTNTSSAQGAVTFGGALNVASSSYSLAFGQQSNAAIVGKQAYASGQFTAGGDAQSGKFVLRISTTNATPAVMTSDAGAASTTNQVILPNDSTYAFTILVVARRTDADNESAGYEFKGVVDRNANAASTALVGTVTKTVLAEDTAAWDVNVTADTTNGGLKVEVTGEAAKTIRWVATCWTSEVTG